MEPVTLSSLITGGWEAAGADGPLLIDPRGPVTTYGQAGAKAAEGARALYRLGVRPGDRVAVQVHKSSDALFLYLACLQLGVVYVPLNPGYTAGEVAHVVADAEPALLVIDPALRPPAGVAYQTLGAQGEGSWARAVLAAADDGAAPEIDHQAHHVAVLLYTSGTTGRPKGAPLTQGNLGANALALRRAWGFQPDDCVAHVLPVYHAHGLLVALNVSLINGTPLLWFDRFEPSALLDALSRRDAPRRATVFMGVPTHYVRLLGDARCQAELLRGVRLWVSGSAPLLAATHDAWYERTGQRILERYGMTETVMLTSNPLVGERRPGSVGLPLDGVEVRLGEVAAPGAPDASLLAEHQAGDAQAGIGEIEVRGPNVFSGYWRRPDLQDETFAPGGWFRTGDLGSFDPDGYLRIVGRAKDLVISGGLNVYPKEVETVLDSLAGVVESAVFGVPDPEWGEVVTAVVVAAPGAQLDSESLRSATRERLASYKVPRRIEIVPELPRNTMGKVEKAVLRRRLAEASR